MAADRGPWGPTDAAPAWPVIASGLQHVAAAAALLSYPVLIGQAAGASPETITALTSLALLASAVGALLQAARLGPLGSGFLCWSSPSIVYLAPSLAAAQVGGLPLVFGMTLFAGVLEMALAPVMRRLRPLFPPEVAGLVGLLAGITTGAFGLKLVLGSPGTEADASAVSTSAAVAAIALAVMVGFNVWGRGTWRLCCVLIGGIVGTVMAFSLGERTAADFAAPQATAWLSLPSLAHWGLAFDATLAVPFAVGALAASIKTAGTVVILDSVTQRRWVRPSMRTVAGGVLADGLSTTVSALAGGIGLNTSSAAAGLATATGMHSRRVAWAIAAICALLALLPVLGWWLQRLPGSVLGAMLVFSAAFMIVNGLQIVTNRMLDARRTLVVGLGLVAGLAVELVPALGAMVSPSARALFATPLTSGTLVALALNLVFRVGVVRSGRMRIEPGRADPAAVEATMTATGAAWGARREVVDRAAFAIVQAAEVVQGSAGIDAPIDVEARFDEFSVKVSLCWTGDPLEIPARRPTNEEIVADEAGMRRLAGFLVGRVADEVACEVRDGASVLSLVFHH